MSGEIKQVFLNTGWLVADKGIRMVMSLLIGVWVARYFGPVDFGVYSYSIAFIAVFNAIATLGIDGLVVRDLVNKPTSINVILGSATALKFVSSLASVALTVLAISWLKADDSVTINLVAVLSLTFLFTPLDVIDFYFQSNLNSKYTIAARLTALILVNLLRVTAVIAGLSLIYFGFIQVIEFVFSAVFLVLIFHFKGKSIRNWKIDWVYIKSLWAASHSLLIDSVLVVVNLQIDRIIIEHFHNDKAVGLYAVGVNLSQLWFFIPMFIGASTVPMMIRKYNEDTLGYARSLQMLFRLMLIFSVSISVTLTIFGTSLIDFLYGAAYNQSASILSIYIWTCVFVFHVSIRSRSLVIEGKSKYVGLFSLIMTVLNIILNLVLVPRFAGEGAAISALSAWTLSVFIVPLFFRSTRKYPVFFFRSFTP